MALPQTELFEQFGMRISAPTTGTGASSSNRRFGTLTREVFKKEVRILFIREYPMEGEYMVTILAMCGEPAVGPYRVFP